MKRGRMFRYLQDRFRRKRFEIFEALLREILETQPEVSVLDMGGRPGYWEKLPTDLRDSVKITCLNFQSQLNGFPASSQDLRIVTVVGDACDMSEFSDGTFDLVHSNSVIEHVGSYQNMKRFADEARRVGKNYYIQTPNYWFPIEPHYGVPFFHWLPDTWRIWLFTRMNVGYARKCSFEESKSRVRYTRMISASTMRTFFPDARIKHERLAFLPKSIMAMRVSH